MEGSFCSTRWQIPSAISLLKSGPECCVSGVQHCRFGIQSVLFWTGPLLKSVALTAPECCVSGVQHCWFRIQSILFWTGHLMLQICSVWGMQYSADFLWTWPGTACLLGCLWRMQDQGSWCSIVRGGSLLDMAAMCCWRSTVIFFFCGLSSINLTIYVGSVLCVLLCDVCSLSVCWKFIREAPIGCLLLDHRQYSRITLFGGPHGPLFQKNFV